jgi:hypothetical protein
MKMTVFWDVAPFSLVEVTDVSEVLAASIIRVIVLKRRQTTRPQLRNIPEDSNLQRSPHPCQVNIGFLYCSV